MTDRAKAFMDEFSQLTVVHGWYPHISVLDDYAGFEVYPFDGRIMLGLVAAFHVGQGDGSRALRWFLQLADKHGVEVIGEVKPLGKNGLNTVELRRWYKRHGFHVNRHLQMTRQPQLEQPQ